MSETIPLVAPITAHGEPITSLSFRRPTGQEVRAIKSLPYKFDKDEAVTLDMEAVMKYIAVCAAIPPTSVDQLDLCDLNTLGWKLAGFFMTAASQPSTT